MLPILILNEKTKVETGRKVQLDNINTAKAISHVIHTCLGPNAMLKMLMDPMGGVVMTNDGNAILREIIVKHPAGKMLIEIARTLDEEVGDGTTSVIMLTGEILYEIENYMSDYHPVSIIKCLRQALDDITKELPVFSKPINVQERQEVINIIKGCLGTKMLGTWSDMACNMALDAVNIVSEVIKGSKTRIDIKNFARVEKIPGGIIEDSQVLEGVMINKDILHHKMRRQITNPRVLLLDCPLEYKKGESQTNVEITHEHDFTRLLEIEEETIKSLCNKIIAANPTVVCTEKGISDLAIHYLANANISALRRVRKTDNNRIARAVGASIVSNMDEFQPHHMGTGAGLFSVQKIGDEYFSFFTECAKPKACTILLRGPSKDILHEVERNLQDALNVARNIHLNPSVVPGGGAVEMAVQRALILKKEEMCYPDDPYSAVIKALEIIPRTLLKNSGTHNIIRPMASLQQYHMEQKMFGVNGVTGELVDAEVLNVWESLSVKQQIFKTAIESAILLLKIDDIVSGAKNRDKLDKPTASPAPAPKADESGDK